MDKETAKETAIEVKNLKISFKTNNGTVKAVRDISFSVNRGETLAIVGESGSGKSVTARAILGIQAGNAINEGGEIFFDGMDLTKISEEDFHDIRGSRISMIFQDPFSSLNQIMKVGKQLTEAMILNGRIAQRAAKRSFTKRLSTLKMFVDKAVGAGKNDENFIRLKQSAEKGGVLETEYSLARANIAIQVTAIDAVLTDIIRGEPKAIAKDIKLIINRADKCFHEYLIKRTRSKLSEFIGQLEAECSAYVSSGDNKKVKELLSLIKNIFKNSLEFTQPDFFALGYYLTYNPAAKADPGNTDELNDITRKYLDDDFLKEFSSAITAGLKLSSDESLAKRKKVLDEINANQPLFDNDSAGPEQLSGAVKLLAEAVQESIDHLANVKNSFEHTFPTGCKTALNNYLSLRKQAGGKAQGADELESARENIRRIIFRLRDDYVERNNEKDFDYGAVLRQTLDKLKDEAFKMSYKVTPVIAKSRAISLMEEVGIPEARARYNQYPFQFSGGMRQRVVIAIALAANPDVLLCDEPSTALDVTIQAQILDLLNSLKVKRRLSVIFITHDLGVVANVADNVAVMYAGKIVEHGTVDEVFLEPAHPYTWALLASMPDLSSKEKLDPIPGTPPNMIFPPKGDAFAARNKYAVELDFHEEPPFFDISPTHKAATWLLHPDAPKMDPPKIVTERIEVMRKMQEEVLRQKSLGVKEITIDGIRYSTNTVLD